jgi:hypothetical protein
MVYSLLKNPGPALKCNGFDRVVVQPIIDLGDARKQRYRQAHPHVLDVHGRAAPAVVSKEGFSVSARSLGWSRASALARTLDRTLPLCGGRCGETGTIIVTASGEVRRA